MSVEMSPATRRGLHQYLQELRIERARITGLIEEAEQTAYQLEHAMLPETRQQLVEKALRLMERIR